MVRKREYTLDDAFFDVELSPIYVATEREENGQLIMFDRSVQIPDFRAVKRVSDGFVFAVVKDSYHLITNREAYELGKMCFKQVFGEADMEFFNLRMPISQSFCTMDFFAKEECVYLSRKSDTNKEEWRVFLRISNSYNRKTALKFDLGFCRSICRNGMIFGEKSIEFKYCHNRSSDYIASEFKLKYERISIVKEIFRKKIDSLYAHKLNKDEMMSEISKALQFRSPKNEKEEKEANERDIYLDNLIDSYCDENGYNAYALLNVLTDFASRPLHNLTAFENNPDTLERRVGEWMMQYA